MTEQNNNIPEGFKMTELGLLPEEWESLSMKSAADIIMGQAPSSDTYNTEGIGLPFFQGKADFGDTHPTTRKWCSLPTKMAEKDDILLSVRAPIGDVNIATERCCIGRGLASIRANQNSEGKYLFYRLVFSKELLESKGTGTTFKEINKAAVTSFMLPLPPLPEQKAIAWVLSTIQKAVETQDKIIAAARELKKSLMRHLFTYGPVPVAEAEKVPLKETEVGPVPEHWEVVRLGEVVIQTQYGLSLRGQTSGQYPILRMNNLTDGHVNSYGLQFVDLNTETFDKFKMNSGDLLFNRTNSHDLVGKTALFDLDDSYVFASYLIRIVTEDRRLLSRFVNYYMNTWFAQARLKSLATRGVSQSNISASKLKGFFMPLPPLAEQLEIAQILSTVDSKIESEENRKVALQTLFKTMLHQLMMGKVRVKDLEAAAA